jgi:glycosyl transferase, family 25
MITKIIRMKDNNISNELAAELSNSLDNLNMSYNFFDAVYGEQIEKIWTKKQLKFYFKQNANKKLPGVKGCFLSHYSLWEECITTDTPYLIFEHDAIMLRVLPNNILDLEYDVLNLDYASRVEADYEKHLNTDNGQEIKSWAVAPEKKGWLSRASKSSIKGLHAYIVKPIGAKKLIKQAHDIGTIPADVHVNSMYVDLKYTVTSYARVNPRYWIDAKTGSSNSFTRAKQ